MSKEVRTDCEQCGHKMMAIVGESVTRVVCQKCYRYTSAIPYEGHRAVLPTPENALESI